MSNQHQYYSCLFRQREFKQLCRIRQRSVGTKFSISRYFPFAHLIIKQFSEKIQKEMLTCYLIVLF